MSLRNSLSRHFRSHRAAVLQRLIIKLAEGKDGLEILDVGGRARYWELIGLPLLEKHNVRITLLNLNATELDGHNTGPFKMVVGDACKMDFPDQSFDLVHSNSVIEHVETWKNMKAFAAETRRVGKHYYVQTPYFWFPIDPHYYAAPLFHWFPRPIRARMLRAFPLSAAGRCDGIDASFDMVDRARLLCGHQFRFLFPDGAHQFERFSGLPKSMIVIR